MYYYIIDPQKINQKNFERVQNQLYSSVSDLKISGEMTRVTSLRTISQLVETAVMRGATTIVAVGHDSTIQEVINEVGDREITIGYVPLVQSEISTVLGISDVVNACQNLAHRRIETLDLGKVNNSYFFTKLAVGNSLDSVRANSIFDFSKYSAAAHMEPIQIKIEVDDEYVAETKVVLGAVFNSRAAKCDNWIADPTDGVLDLLLLPKLTSYEAWKYRNEIASGCFENIPECAVIHGKRITFTSPEGMPFYVGDKTVAKVPTTIEVVQNKVRMIVGKDRTF